MGILNITPDSFSDGGKYIDIEAAVKRAKDMAQDGAHIIDIGGESTRPGYEPVDEDVEINRVVPVIERLSREIDIPISVDTSKAAVAKKALLAGASIVNDIWGLQKDVYLADVVAQSGAGVVMMYNRDDKNYTDVIDEIKKFLNKSIAIAEKAGIKRSHMAIDPGIGFGKTFVHNIETLRRLDELNSLGLPVLLGTSRKSFIGKILDLTVDERMEGTAATVALGIAANADIMRVHDVKEMSRVARVSDAIVR
ncbi:MAG TPA: dihydropteroate synthase [Clostridia bacterium]